MNGLTDTPHNQIATAEQEVLRARRLRLLWAGLAIGFGLPLAFGLVDRGLAMLGWSSDFDSTRLLAELTVIIALLVLSLRFERLPLGSLGLHRVRALDLYFGLLVGAGLIVLTAAIAGFFTLRNATHANLFADLLDAMAPADILTMRGEPVGLALTVVIAAVVAEELAARGYAIRRLRAFAGTRALAILAALALDFVARIPFWGMRYALVILPAEAILAALYVWRRQLTPCIIAHLTLMLTVFFAIGVAGNRTATSASAASNAPSLEEEMAIVELRRSMGQATGPGSASADRAVNLYNQHDYPHALEQIDDAIRVDPKNAFYFGARAAIRAAQDNTYGAIADYTAMIELRPNDARIYRERAQQYKLIRDFPKAAADLDKAIALAPTDALNFEARASLRYWQAQYSDAIADLTTAISLDPSNRRLLIDRAYFYEHIAQHSRALDDCNALIKSDPKRPEGYECRFNVYQNMGNANEAIAAATSAIALDPDNAELYSTRGNLLLSLGRWREAHEDFEKVANLAPDDPRLIDGVAWRLATFTADEVRDGKAALKLAVRENEVTEYSRYKYLETLAAAYAETGDTISAVKWETAALAATDATDPDEREVMRVRLQIFQQGRPVRENDSGGFAGERPMRAYVIGFAILIFAVIGLVALIYWSAQWSIRRARRVRPAT